MWCTHPKTSTGWSKAWLCYTSKTAIYSITIITLSSTLFPSKQLYCHICNNVLNYTFQICDCLLHYSPGILRENKIPIYNFIKKNHYLLSNTWKFICFCRKTIRKLNKNTFYKQNNMRIRQMKQMKNHFKSQLSSTVT